MPSSIDGVDRAGDVRHFDKAELADEIRLLALRERVGRANRLHEIVIVAPRIVVRRDHVDVRIVERLHWHAVQRLAVDHQVIRIELLDVGGDLARPLGRGVDFVAGFPAEDRRLVAIGDAGVACSCA